MSKERTDVDKAPVDSCDAVDAELYRQLREFAVKNFGNDAPYLLEAMGKLVSRYNTLLDACEQALPVLRAAVGDDIGNGLSADRAYWAMYWAVNDVKEGEL